MPDRSPRRVVMVAGMHRAGTSVVARGLMALGLDLGDALMDADARMNARGFFEDVDVVAADDALLASRGADWKSSALLHDVDWRDAAYADARRAARALIERKVERTGDFAFKDPRVPRLLPFWQGILADAGVDDAYVIAVRHPCAVVDSLVKRDDLDPRRSAGLWLSHLACALRYTAGRPRVVVDYDRLLESPMRELARMARALDLRDSALDRAREDPFERVFLSTDLRHARYAPDDLPAGLPEDVAAAQRLAQALASDELDPQGPEAAHGIDALFDRLVEAAPLLAYAGDVERDADRVPRLAAELAWATGALREATTYSEDLKAHLANRDERIAALEATLEETIDRGLEYQADLVSHLERKERELVVAHGLLDRVRERLAGRLVLRAITRKERESGD